MSLGFLLGLFGIVAPAGESGESAGSSPQIISKNISYDSEIYTYYAVPVDSVAEGAEVEMVFYKSNGITEAYRVGPCRTENVRGTLCYIFRNNGVAPKDIKRYEVVRAETSDGAVSEPVKYSVLQYLCEKLFYEGYAAKSALDGDDDIRRRLFLQLIQYATSAQNLLEPTASPIDDFSFIGIYRSSISGFCEEGDTVTLELASVIAPEYKRAAYFTVNKYDVKGNLLGSEVCIDGDTVTVDGPVLVIPGFENAAPDDKTVIFEDSAVNIAVAGDVEDESVLADELASLLAPKLGWGSVKVSDAVDSSNSDINIIIGKSGDAVSVKAYEKLAEVRSDKFFSEAKYVIYIEDGRIAVAYDVNTYTDVQSVTHAFGEIAEMLAFESDVAVLDDGETVIGQVDLIAQQTELDAVEEAENWEELLVAAVAKYGSEGGVAIVDALKTYYNVRSDGLILWYANLYDPGIGGFYASTTGKIYDSFLPPIETTGQLLGHLVSLNLMDSKLRGLPPEIIAQVVYYIKSCQDSNGYFYNPQLGKVESDKTLVRRGRDLSRCTSLLADFGLYPTYNTPQGIAGDGVSADEFWEKLTTGSASLSWWQSKARTSSAATYWYNLSVSGLFSSATPKPYVPKSLDDYREHLESLTESLTADAAEAVSLMMARSGVALASETVESDTVVLDDYVSSPQKFAAYLNGLKIDESPYSIGNELNGTYKIIENASKYVTPVSGTGEWYDGMTLKEMLISWLTSHIDPDTGLFGTAWRTDGSSATMGVEFINTNGFFKIITIYNAFEVAYPEPVKAAAGLISGISGDEASLTNICNVYNAWSALGSLITNTNNYITDEALKQETLDLINDTFSTGAAEAIIKSYNKQKAYQCEDGTFSNSVNGSAASYPGGLAVSFGAKEGNVDAIGFGFYAIVDSMYSVLGLSGSKVRYFYDHSYMLFVETILSLDPVTEKVGSGVNDINYVTDFEQKTLGELHRITAPSVYANDNEPTIVEEADGNRALEIVKSYTGEGTSALVKQYVTYKEESADTLVWSGRIKVSDIITKSELQFTLGSSSGKSPVCYIISTATSSGKTYMRLTNNGNESYTTGVQVGEWFDLRFEYRVTATDESGAPTAFECLAFVNNEYLCVTTQPYGTGKTLYSVQEIESCSLSLNNSMAATVCVDDIKLQARRSFVEKSVSTGNSYSVTTDGTAVAHTYVKSSGTSGPTYAIKPTYTESGATKFVWGAKIKASSLTSALQLQLTAMSTSSSPFVAMLYSRYAYNSSYIYTSSSWSSSSKTAATVGSWFDYRVEYSYYTDENGQEVYLWEQFVNGTLVSSNTTKRTGDQVKFYTPNEINRITLSINASNAGTYQFYGIYSYTVK